MDLSTTAAQQTQRVTEAGRNTGYRAVYIVEILRRSLSAAVEHDFLTVAQATAYSAMVALFPALIVAAAVTALLPGEVPLRMQMALFFDRVLPSNVIPVVDAYFGAAGSNPQTARAILSAAIVSITGASSVVATLMEGFRRAHDLPQPQRSFWRRRGRSIALVPLALVPLTLASALVVFGRILTAWLSVAVPSQIRIGVLVIAFLLRWSVSLAGSVGIIAVIYHLGTDTRKHIREHMGPLLSLRIGWSWRSSLPGAVVATILWFVTTLCFGYYVTRFANYSQVYGTLGAAIALMFWLYIIALSVLVGSEFNAQLQQDRIRTSKSERQVE